MATVDDVKAFLDNIDKAARDFADKVGTHVADAVRYAETILAHSSSAREALDDLPAATTPAVPEPFQNDDKGTSDPSVPVTE